MDDHPDPQLEQLERNPHYQELTRFNWRLATIQAGLDDGVDLEYVLAAKEAAVALEREIPLFGDPKLRGVLQSLVCRTQDVVDGVADTWRYSFIGDDGHEIDTWQPEPGEITGL